MKLWRGVRLSLVCCLIAMVTGCNTTPPLAGLPAPPLATESPAQQVPNPETEAPLADELPAQEVPSPETRLVALAHTLLNVRYRYGGDTPETGFDCSGFIGYVFRESLGTMLPRRIVEISRMGQAIERTALLPGDLVFFNTRGSRNSHAGIYIGNDQFIHAPSSGKRIHIVDMTEKYWKKRYNGARRLTAAAAPGVVAQDRTAF